jgi:site-specific recombinase XerD
MSNKLNLIPTKTDGIKKDANTGIFYIYKSINNRYLRQSLKTKDYSRAKLLYLKALNQSQNLSDKRIKANISIDDLFIQYLDYCKHVKKLSYETIKWYNNKIGFLVNMFSGINVIDFTEKHYEEYIIRRSDLKSSKSDNGLKKITLNGDIRAHRSFFNYALKEKYIQENPLKDIEEFSVSKRSRKAIDVSKYVLSFISEVQNINKVYYYFLSMIYYTLGRRTEILNLKISDIDIAKNEVTIWGKGEKYRTVPLTDKAVECAKEIMEMNKNINNPDNRLFPTLTKNSVIHYLKFARSRISMEKHITHHVIRHSGATYLLEQGVHVGVIQELLGHTSISTTMIYLNIQDERKREAVNLL